MSKTETWRFIAAACIAPAVPIGALSLAYWVGTSGANLSPFFALFGYAYFAVIGLPVMGILVVEKSLKSSVITGALLVVSPVILLGLLSLFSTKGAFDLRFIGNLGLLSAVGALGGAAFWIIAFAQQKVAVGQTATN
jgi:hypothetical protein